MDKLPNLLKAVSALFWTALSCLHMANAAPLAGSPALDAQQDASVARDVTASDVAKQGVSVQAVPDQHLHAGYPTTREQWRYCPRDGSHQCVDLDIPGVTVPDQQPGL